MKSSTSIVIVFIIGCFSCSTNDRATKNTKEKLFIDTVKKAEIETAMPYKTDTIKRFVVDNYPLTEDMFGIDVNGTKIKSNNVASIDKFWFTNDTLNQTIVVELYTDNFRMVTFHFLNDNIPKELIRRMELHLEGGNLASQQEKEMNFKSFINSSKRISKRYFVTTKGFKPGDSKQKAFDIYGTPDKKTKEGNIEILEWDFVGEILYDGKTNLKGKPLARDSYGHQAIMFFKNNKLIALIFHNYIP